MILVPAAVLLAFLAGQAVGQAGTPVLSARFDLTTPARTVILPPALAEVSGLAFTAEGRLLAHDDERGRVHAVDPGTGMAERSFAVGSPPVADDLEGIAVAGERLFMISSRGILYEFRDPRDGASSPVRVTDTGLGRGCEAEGLAWDAGTRTLLVACKTLRPQAPEVRIHRVAMDAASIPTDPIRVPWASFARHGHEGPVHPSGIEVDPNTGTLVLLAAREDLLFEVSPDGRLKDVVALPRERHPQPEGIAFGPDGHLYIADEGAGGSARLTSYAPLREGGGR